MLDLLLVPIAVIYLAVVMMLFIYGVNFFYLSFLAWNHRHVQDENPPLIDLPRVTVQLPIFNELYVAERSINAAARLEYPGHLLEIQVLDDSTDETIELVRASVERWRARGVNITHLHRTSRAGYKAGALAEGMKLASGEFITFFDADFVPPPDFLRRTLPHLQDPRVAFVQARWDHLNRDYSFLTQLQSLAIDAHFAVEQFARSRGGYWFNFNGTAGVWRRKALEDAGGWTADTLTEDLDVSYRAFLRGWNASYLRDVPVAAELPVNFGAYRRQQHRWARGSLECSIKLIPRIWESKISLARKIQSSLHLTGYAVHLLMFALALLYPIALVLTERYSGLISLFGLATIFTSTAFAPTLFFALGQQQLARNWKLALPSILFITILGAGMMINTLRAALQIFYSPSRTFERTPKFGIETKTDDWRQRRYQLKLDPIIYAELAFALFNLSTAVLAVSFGNYLIAGYALVFCAGLCFAVTSTIAQAFQVRATYLMDSDDATLSILPGLDATLARVIIPAESFQEE